MRDAGICFIQAGIESLSSPILKLMRKGTTAIQNIQFLKWCREYGINVYWNFLCGFPGETAEEYYRMADLIPLLFHLPPPGLFNRMNLVRFSPYFEKPGIYGIKDIAPLTAYEVIYPKVDFQTLSKLAYSFTFKDSSLKDLKIYTQRIREIIDEWKSSHMFSELFFNDDGNELQVWDTRPFANQPLTLLKGLERKLYLSCDSVNNVTKLCKSLDEQNRSPDFRMHIQETLNAWSIAFL